MTPPRTFFESFSPKKKKVGSRPPLVIVQPKEIPPRRDRRPRRSEKREPLHRPPRPRTAPQKIAYPTAAHRAFAPCKGDKLHFTEQSKAKGLRQKQTPYFCAVPFGAAGRTRTDMELPPTDFESVASANFATAASGDDIDCSSIAYFSRKINMFFQKNRGKRIVFARTL